MWNRPAFGRAAGAALALITSCGWAGAQTVVVSSALDQEFSQPVLREYARKSGGRVLLKFDVESTKTVGLTNLIIAEAGRPRCDLFWNNEILNTLRLKERSLLAPSTRPTHVSPRRAPARAAVPPPDVPGAAGAGLR